MVSADSLGTVSARALRLSCGRASSYPGTQTNAYATTAVSVGRDDLERDDLTLVADRHPDPSVRAVTSASAS